MIKTHIAYHPEKKLFEAYNDFMSRLENGEWACFLDHDAMFTTRNWYLQLLAIIKKHPGVACFTAMTNRIQSKAKLQLVTHQSARHNHDIKFHRNLGQKLSEKHWDEIKILPRSPAMSGVLILYSKDKWKKTPFRSYQRSTKMRHFLGVDYQIHRDLLDRGEKVAVMRGVYVYHWYRADGDLSHID